MVRFMQCMFVASTEGGLGGYGQLSLKEHYISLEHRSPGVVISGGGLETRCCSHRILQITKLHF